MYVMCAPLEDIVISAYTALALHVMLAVSIGSVQFSLLCHTCVTLLVTVFSLVTMFVDILSLSFVSCMSCWPVGGSGAD